MLNTTTPPSGRNDARPIEIVGGLADLASRYDLLFCDIWGVLHDGLTAFPAAGDALARYRAGGGRVILVSNAPRPGFVVARQLDGMGLGREAYDAVVTSGDMTRKVVEERGTQMLHHVGPERDIRLFEGLPARFGSVEDADYVVCTGLVNDEIETVADYAAALARMRERDLPLVCANPDIVVERGHRLIPCAGAIAAAYDAIGGTSITYGKPHRPIYEEAMAVGTRLVGQSLDPRRILAVGDAIRTDVAGGRDFGLDVLMVARGIHAAELGVAGARIDPAVAEGWLVRQSHRPTSLITELAWA